MFTDTPPQTQQQEILSLGSISFPLWCLRNALLCGKQAASVISLPLILVQKEVDKSHPLK